MVTDHNRVDTRTRAARAADATAVRDIAVATGLFQPDELGDFDAMYAGYCDGSLTDHAWLVAQADGVGVIGAAYYAPEPFSDRVWNLYFLGVRPDHHGGGIGGVLVDTVEQALREAGAQVARVLIVETSSTEGFESTRGFYRKLGFDQEARIRQFYGPDDDKIVFWKSLVEPGVGGTV
ncbi:MAG: GNAT family N-acetyltransferase [Deltaproteobacteria bacterium]|nr:GNAT family N-acetyltransferase [Deltaproteobacteria bacterium]